MMMAKMMAKVVYINLKFKELKKLVFPPMMTHYTTCINTHTDYFSAGQIHHRFQFSPNEGTVSE